jgi:hypothetical protein
MPNTKKLPVQTQEQEPVSPPVSITTKEPVACRVVGCGKVVFHAGKCEEHATRCCIEGCERPLGVGSAKGMCHAHYARLRSGRTTDLNAPMVSRNEQEPLVPLVRPKVRREVKAAIESVARAQSTSEYEVVRRILDGWYDKYKEVVPPPVKR